LFGLQKAAAPANSVGAAQPAPFTNELHWLPSAVVSQLSTSPVGHWLQLVVSQSRMHPVAWLHAASTNGAAHRRTPLSCPNVSSNGARQELHPGLVACSNAKKAMHAADVGPPAHAARACWRSLAVHTCWMLGTGVVADAGHALYGTGHVDWSRHARGDAFVLHCDLVCVQSTHDAPLSPQLELRKPPSHSPCAPQQPRGQVAGPHGGGVATHVWLVHSRPAPQLVHATPRAPHAASVVPPTQTPLLQHPLQFDGPHAGCAQAPLTHVCPRAPQSWHVAPPAPHALVCPPTAHTPFTQHPPQLWGPHVGTVWHTPAVQVWFAEHA
jgi:hypothetical protein